MCQIKIRVSSSKKNDTNKCQEEHIHGMNMTSVVVKTINSLNLAQL